MLLAGTPTLTRESLLNCSNTKIGDVTKLAPNFALNFGTVPISTLYIASASLTEAADARYLEENAIWNRNIFWEFSRLMERGAFLGLKWAMVTKSFFIRTRSGSPNGIGWLLIDIDDTGITAGIVHYLCADLFSK